EVVMLTRVPWRLHGWRAGENLRAVLVEHDVVPIGGEVFAGGERGAFGGSAEPLVVGPEFQVGLGNIDLCVGEIAAAVRRHDPADMVDVRVGGDDRVDVGGVDTGLLVGGGQPPHGGLWRCRTHAG